jgi:hypothetical protein
MNTRKPFGQFITLGQRLYVLMNPNILNVDKFVTEINGFLQLLADCDLPRTRNAAAPLADVQSISYFPQSGLLAPSAITYFSAQMASIHRVLYAEADETELIVIKSGVVAQQLRALPAKLAFNPTQKNLLDETILSMEAGAYRAAIVMGWSLAYDFIRQWVFNNHLEFFNQALTSRLDRNNKPRYDSIVGNRSQGGIGGIKQLQNSPR